MKIQDKPLSTVASLLGSSEAGMTHGKVETLLTTPNSLGISSGIFSKAHRKIETVVKNSLLHKYGIPKYKTSGSAGMDLVACIDEPVVLAPGRTVLIGTGFGISINDSELVAVVSSRSGLYLNHNVRVGQGTGIIDSDYHGEIGVLLHNDGDVIYTVMPGERIAQLLFMPVEQVDLILVDEFSVVTDRGEGGFGHTGKHG